MAETVLFGIATLAVLYLTWWLWKNDDGSNRQRKKFSPDSQDSGNTDT